MAITSQGATLTIPGARGKVTIPRAVCTVTVPSARAVITIPRAYGQIFPLDVVIFQQDWLLQENGFPLLTEGGDYIQLETKPPSVTSLTWSPDPVTVGDQPTATVVIDWGFYAAKRWRILVVDTPIINWTNHPTYSAQVLQTFLMAETLNLKIEMDTVEGTVFTDTSLTLVINP